MKKLSLNNLFPFGKHNINLLLKQAKPAYYKLSTPGQISWDVRAKHKDIFGNALGYQAFSAFVISVFNKTQPDHYKKKLSSFSIDPKPFSEKDNISVSSS